MIFAKFLALILLGQIQGQQDDSKIWPDISCHSGEFVEDLVKVVKKANIKCGRETTPSPWMESLDSSLGHCPKICVLEQLSFLKYNEGYDGPFMNFQKDNNSLALMTLGWDDAYSLKLVNKVRDDCDEIFHRVLYVEKHPCNSEKANEVYDCVQKALKC